MSHKKTTKVMGNFEQAPHRSENPKHCKNCGKPVRETTGNSGYCKKCIALAKVLNTNKEKGGEC